ncbi:MAG: hypothetical protein QG567_1039 [Campylobacterota bacterium]|nr:hypothetical protein [Campylobacterota bacterium]
MMEKIINGIDAFSEIVGKIASFVLIALILLVVFDTASRYIFSAGSIALQELEWYLFAIVFLLGISYALKHKSHVRVDIFYENFSYKTKELLNIFGIVFFIIPFSFFIIYNGFDFSYTSFVENEVSANPGGLEYMFVIKSFIWIGFLLLVLQAFCEIIKSIQILTKKEI